MNDKKGLDKTVRSKSLMKERNSPLQMGWYWESSVDKNYPLWDKSYKNYQEFKSKLKEKYKDHNTPKPFQGHLSNFVV